MFIYTVMNRSPDFTHFPSEGNWTRSRSAFGSKLRLITSAPSDRIADDEEVFPAVRVRYAQPAVTFIKRACKRTECVGALSSSSRSMRTWKNVFSDKTLTYKEMKEQNYHWKDCEDLASPECQRATRSTSRSTE